MRGSPTRRWWAAGVAFSPTLDGTFSGASMDDKAGIDPIFTRESLQATNARYLAGQNPDQALVSPAVAADLSGHPALLLQALDRAALFLAQHLSSAA